MPVDPENEVRRLSALLMRAYADVARVYRETLAGVPPMVDPIVLVVSLDSRYAEVYRQALGLPEDLARGAPGFVLPVPTERARTLFPSLVDFLDSPRAEGWIRCVVVGDSSVLRLDVAMPDLTPSGVELNAHGGSA
jgi:hypothetical protein